MTGSVDMKSPNGRIHVEAAIRHSDDKKECFAYRILYDQNILTDWSPFGFILKGAPALESGFKILGVVYTQHDSCWKHAFSEKSEVRDYYNEWIIQLQEKEKPERMLDITFRIYDSGLAFRYTFRKSPTFYKLQIIKELTRFVFPNDYYAYATYTAQGLYEKVKISQINPGCERPLVIELGKRGPYVALAEAGLVNYARMKFSVEKGYTLVSELTGKPLYFLQEEAELKNLPEDSIIKVEGETPFTTPWRVVMIADSAASLYEQNDLLLNLNEPCTLKDISFIRPGKVIREMTLTTEGGMACVDFAVRRNLQYVEFDAGWYGNEYDFASDASFVSIDPLRYRSSLDLQKVIAYAKEKGIRIMLYINHRAMVQQLDQLLPLYKKWGVDGLKFGFVETGTQRWTKWLHECVRKAAQYGFVLTVHDEYRPTGFQRTCPNLLTQEGIRGDEEKQPAENTLIITFTRMLAGPADNTICYFDQRVKEYWSHAYQLAKSVVLFSPLQFLYWYDRPIGSFNTNGPEIEMALLQGRYDDLANIITDEPELEFFDHLVTTWDETRVLAGEIGQYIIMARRSGEHWFVGLMNARAARSFSISLSFLTPEIEYTADIYTDDETLNTRTNVKIERISVTRDKVLEYDVGSDKGLAMRIVPKKPSAEDWDVRPDTMCNAGQ